jgi:hypothetical protein
MEVRLHFVMLEELEGGVGTDGLSAGNSPTPAGEPPAIARLSIVRGTEPGDVDLEFDEGL